jgi:hypothetical protein
VKRLKELERENARLRKAVSDLALEKVILKEAASGKRHALPTARLWSRWYATSVSPSARPGQV